MNFPPTLKQLKYLTALHKTLHFGKAADLCHVTQSTLSAGLQELEALLNIQLVERTKRTVMFTAAGENIVKRAHFILNEVDDLMAAAVAEKDPTKGMIRMGIIPTIAPFLLPKIMPAIRQQLPDLDLYLREDKSADLCEQLKNGDLDVVLYALPFTCGEVTEHPLFEDKFLAAYPPDTDISDTISNKDLEDTKLLLLEEGHCLRDHALDACHLQNYSHHQSLSGTSLPTIVEMVAGGYGATLLPEMAVKSGIAEAAGLKLAEFKDLTPSRTIGLIWRPSNPREEAFKKLGDIIKGSCQ